MGVLFKNDNTEFREIDCEDDSYSDSYGTNWNWGDDNLTASVNDTEFPKESIHLNSAQPLMDDMASVESEIEIIKTNQITAADEKKCSMWRPNIFDCIDNILLLSFFRDTSLFAENAYNYGRSEQIVVKMKATTLSQRKNLRNDEYLEFFTIEKLHKADSTFVGEVHYSSIESPLSEGTLVTSVHKCPVDARLAEFPIESLVVLPEKLDPGEAAAVVGTYLPAFFMLHHGSRNRENRFSLSSLSNLNILLVGGDSTEQEALAKLAILGGARKVLILNSQDQVLNLSEKNNVGSSNIVLLKGDHVSELCKLRGKVDVLIDMEFPMKFKEVRACLKPSGRMVSRGSKERGPSTILTKLCDILEQAALLIVDGAYLFDFEYLCEREYPDVLRDLKFLFRLLSLRKIRPNINKYITKKDILAIKAELHKNPVTGDVICESR